MVRWATLRKESQLITATLSQIPETDHEKLRKATQAFNEELFQLQQAWQLQEQEEVKIFGNGPGILNDEHLPREVKTTWSMFTAQLTHTYIRAALAGSNSREMQNAIALSELLELSDEILHTKQRGNRMMERNTGAKAQAAIALALEKEGFIVIRPLHFDPETLNPTPDELSRWEKRGVDMVALGPNGETALIDSKGRRYLYEVDHSFPHQYQPDNYQHIVQDAHQHLRDNQETLRKHYPETFDQILTSLGSQTPLTIEIHVPAGEEFMSPVGEIHDSFRRQQIAQLITQERSHAYQRKRTR